MQNGTYKRKEQSVNRVPFFNHHPALERLSLLEVRHVQLHSEQITIVHRCHPIRFRSNLYSSSHRPIGWFHSEANQVTCHNWYVRATLFSKKDMMTVECQMKAEIHSSLFQFLFLSSIDGGQPSHNIRNCRRYLDRFDE